MAKRWKSSDQRGARSGADPARHDDRLVLHGVLGGSLSGVLLLFTVAVLDDPSGIIESLRDEPWKAVIVLLTFGAVPGMFMGWGLAWCRGRLGKRVGGFGRGEAEHELGYGLWRTRYRRCASEVERFGRCREMLAEAGGGAAADWLGDMHDELRRDLEQVRLLARTGHLLRPNALGDGALLSGPSTKIDARLRGIHRRLRDLAEAAEELVVAAHAVPDVSDVAEDLDQLRSVVSGLRESLVADALAPEAVERPGTAG